MLVFKIIEENNLWGLDEFSNTSSSRCAFIFGSFYKDQGRYQEAKTIYEQALAGFEKALGLEHISTLFTIDNLGGLY